jgi:hypothetical protein
MSLRLFTGIVAIACVIVCGLLGTLASFDMIDKVNAKLSENEKFAEMWWYSSKTMRLHREYKRLYPAGRLLLRVRVLGALMFALIVIAAWSFGFFAR